VATTQGVDPFLKATLPTRVLRRRRLSLDQRAPRSPYDNGGWVPRVMRDGPGQKKPKPSRAERVTAQRLQALLHLRLNQRVKGQAADSRLEGGGE
jgi:hypothetical protein